MHHSNTSHVLVYRFPGEPGKGEKRIQIHLMFLFIWEAETIKRIADNSNTSHVLVYLSPVVPIFLPSFLIQIHLMFLFIVHPAIDLTLVKNHSNTSHVLVYLQETGQQALVFKHSNTSHVLVYQSFSSSSGIGKEHSNTSHVLVYPTYLRPSVIYYTPTGPIKQAFSEILPAVLLKYYLCLHLSLKPRSSKPFPTFHPQITW